MMNCKGIRKKLSWANFKVLSVHSPGETEENHEKPSLTIAVLHAEI
jgi:hypothetical protein